MAHFHDNALIGASGQGGYQIERSLRFNRPDSAYLNRTPASAGNRRTWTWSGWVKRSVLGVHSTLFHAYDGSSSRRAQFYFNTSNQFEMNQGGGGTTAIGTTTAVFRDTSAWYHILFYADYTNTTFKLYVNNVEQTISYSSSVINADGQINAAIAHQIGGDDGSGAYFPGYMAEIHFIDGQALTPSSFGETDTITGVWKPKKYSGTYGTNGFYLKFADNSGTTSTTLGKDSSGNGNNWTPNNFSVTAGAGNDSMIDTPTPYADGGNGRGNYCTWNSALGVGESGEAGSRRVCSNGNLEVSLAPWDSNRMVGTMGISSGKWYWEIVETSTAQAYDKLGIVDQQYGGRLGWSFTPASLKIYAYENGQGKYSFVSGSTTRSSYGGNSFATNDVIGVALDATAGELTFYKNGVSQGAAFTGLTSSTGFWYPMVGQDTGSFTSTWVANFGQRPFAYTPPSGFLALNTQNLPEPSMKKPSSYMDVLTYTGDSNATKTITGLGFNPDLVWIKNRNNANPHAWFDSVRGVNKFLSSNYTTAEENPGLYGYVSAFNSDGFTLTTYGPSGYGYVNGVSNTYVAWCWDESATPGFDIVTYTGDGVAGRTVSHSLGVAPSMMIVKSRSNAHGWAVYHSSFGNTGAIFLNGTGTFDVSSAYWNNTTPTSSVFSLGTANVVNLNTYTYVAYLWSEVAGFSKFGSYTGNGSTDGPFVFCGFRPKVVWFKRTDSTGSWFIEDSARGTYNVMGPELYANLSDTESTVTRLDFLSNGFKMRAANAGDNASGGTYIFCAWAESPFKYSLAR